MPTVPITPGDTLKKLLDASAFRGVQKYILDEVQVQQKVSEICADYLARFRHDQELRQTRDDLLARARGALANARAVNRGDLARDRLRREAEALKRAADLAGRAAGLHTEFQFLNRHQDGGLILLAKGERASTVRARRDASHLDMLTVDLCVVLRRATKLSIVGIVGTALPPIFEALGAAHPDLLPKRGLSDPESRFKRFLKSARKIFRSQGERKTSLDLLKRRERTLLAADPRFRPRPARSRKVAPSA